jgi:hypothetical protein
MARTLAPVSSDKGRTVLIELADMVGVFHEVPGYALHTGFLPLCLALVCSFLERLLYPASHHTSSECAQIF